MKRLFAFASLLLLCSAHGWGQVRPGHASVTITTSGTSKTIFNDVNGVTSTFYEQVVGTPATLSVVIKGCMSGDNNCADGDTLDTYTTVANSIRKPAISSVYDFYQVTASWTGGSNVSVTVNTTVTTAKSGGVLLSPAGASGDLPCVQTTLNQIGSCDSGKLKYANSTLFAPNLAVSTSSVTGASYVGSGKPGDSTVGSSAGGTVQWDATNHRWTQCAGSTTVCLQTLYIAANTANGTGSRADFGLPGCGGGGTVGGAAVCVYTNASIGVATFDGAVTEGHLAGQGSTAGQWHDLATSAISSVGASTLVNGVIISAGSGSPVQATLAIWQGYKTPASSSGQICTHRSTSDQVSTTSGAFATTCTLVGSQFQAETGIDVIANGTYHNGTGSTQSGSLIMKFGSTTVLTSSATSINSGVDGAWRLEAHYAVSTLNGATSKVQGHGMATYRTSSGGGAAVVMDNQTTTAEISNIDLSGNLVVSIVNNAGSMTSSTINLDTIQVKATN